MVESVEGFSSGMPPTASRSENVRPRDLNHTDGDQRRPFLLYDSFLEDGKLPWFPHYRRNLS